MAKVKLVIRLLPEVYAVLERYAAWSDQKTAALIAAVLHGQCEAARRAGEAPGCRRYALDRAGVEMVPTNRNGGKSSTGQISVRLSAEDAAMLDTIARNNPEGLRIVGGRLTYTYRRIIPGMLLNDPIFADLHDPARGE